LKEWEAQQSEPHHGPGHKQILSKLGREEADAAAQAEVETRVAAMHAHAMPVPVLLQAGHWQQWGAQLMPAHALPSYLSQPQLQPQLLLPPPLAPSVPLQQAHSQVQSAAASQQLELAHAHKRLRLAAAPVQAAHQAAFEELPSPVTASLSLPVRGTWEDAEADVGGLGEQQSRSCRPLLWKQQHRCAYVPDHVCLKSESPSKIEAICLWSIAEVLWVPCADDANCAGDCWVCWHCRMQGPEQASWQPQPAGNWSVTLHCGPGGRARSA
jgi:hypothetical protein